MQTLLSQYGYLMLFFASFFEWQVSTLVAWFLIRSGHFNLWIAFTVIIFADITNDTLYYLIGRGIIKSKRFSSFVDRSNFLSYNMSAMKKLWHNHPLKTMIFGKNAYIISVAIIISAGATKMSYPAFLSYSIPSSFIQPVILLFIGYYLWNWYNIVGQYIKYPGIIIAIILIIIMYLYHKFGKNIAKRFDK